MTYYEVRKYVFEKAIKLESFTVEDLVREVRQPDMSDELIRRIIGDMLDTSLFSRTYDRYNYIFGKRGGE